MPDPQISIENYRVSHDENLTQSRLDKNITPCGSRPADLFFANVVGQNLSEQDMWSPREYARWIMPPNKEGEQDPGTRWPSFVTDPTQLKGVIHQSIGNGNYKRYQHNGGDFIGHYFSPWTVQGVFRKSRPALVIQWQSFLPLNGHKVDQNTEERYAKPGSPTHTGKKERDLKNPCPLNLSVHRTRTAKLYRKLFLEEFHKTPGACDGVYVFKVRKVPEHEIQTREAMNRMIKHVRNDWGDSKTLFQTDSRGTIETALRIYKATEPLTPELKQVRLFDPTVEGDPSRDKPAQKQNEKTGKILRDHGEMFDTRDIWEETDSDNEDWGY